MDLTHEKISTFVSGGSNLPNEQVPGIGGVQVNLGAEQQHHTPANYANYANLDTR